MKTQTINLIVPRGWHELDDKQLRYFFGLPSDLQSVPFEKFIYCVNIGREFQGIISDAFDRY